MRAGEPKKHVVREYEIRLHKTAGDDGAIDGKTQIAVEGWLNRAGADGFRLVRAEADAQGVMWLIMERQSEAGE